MPKTNRTKRAAANPGVLTAGRHAGQGGRVYGRLSLVRASIKPGRRYQVRQLGEKIILQPTRKVA